MPDVDSSSDFEKRRLQRGLLVFGVATVIVPLYILAISALVFAMHPTRVGLILLALVCVGVLFDLVFFLWRFWALRKDRSTGA